MQHGERVEVEVRREGRQALVLGEGVADESVRRGKEWLRCREGEFGGPCSGEAPEGEVPAKVDLEEERGGGGIVDQLVQCEEGETELSENERITRVRAKQGSDRE